MLRAVLVALAAALALTGCASTVAGTPAAVSRPVVTPAAGRTASAPPASASPRPVAARPEPKANPCATNTHAQLVRVSLRAQHLWLCAHRRLAYSTPITSGMLGQYTETPTGTYATRASPATPR